MSGQIAIYGSSPLTSRYLNFNEQDFGLYIGMKLWLYYCRQVKLGHCLLGGAPQDQQLVSSSFNGCISEVSLGPLGALQMLQLDSAVNGQGASYCST